MEIVNAFRMDGLSEAAIFVSQDSNLYTLDDLYGLDEPAGLACVAPLAKQSIETGKVQHCSNEDGMMAVAYPVWLRYRGKSYLKGCLAGSPPKPVTRNMLKSCGYIMGIVADSLTEKISAAFLSDIVNRDRRELEERLKIVDNTIVDVINSVSAAFVLISSDMTVAWHNNMLSKMCGHANIVGKVCHKEIWSSNNICAGCMVKQTLETGKPQSGNIRVGSASRGTHYYKVATAPVFNESGEVKYVLELVQDITEAWETESELARYKRLVNNSDDLMFICNGKLEILAANHKFLECTQYKEREITGMSVFSISPQHELERTLKTSDTLRTTGMMMNFGQILKKDGSIIPVQMFFTYDSKADIYEAVLKDMSERMRLEQEIRTRSEELQAQNSKAMAAIEEKNRFFRNVSHELRTPLTSIIGFAELLLEDTQEPLSERQKAQLGRVVGNSHKLLAMVNDLLDLSRLDAGRMRLECGNVNVEEMLGQIVCNMMPLAQNKKLSVSVSIPKKLPVIITDEQKLGQIVVNLLSNAIKFTQSGGVTIKAVKNAKFISISVSDTGVGIPEGELEEIFMEFSRGSASNVGTGLGLAIARRLAGFLGGEISVSSKVGVGSTFMLKMPIMQKKDSRCAV
ncbi:PAS domain S-box protein [bacterium]|nr:PAS domain S-box protein [bacterium]